MYFKSANLIFQKLRWEFWLILYSPFSWLWICISYQSLKHILFSQVAWMIFPVWCFHSALISSAFSVSDMKLFQINHKYTMMIFTSRMAALSEQCSSINNNRSKQTVINRIIWNILIKVWWKITIKIDRIPFERN